MRTTKRFVCITTVMLPLVQATGCVSHKRLEGVPPQMPDRVRATTKAGEKIVLLEVQADSLKVSGRDKNFHQRVEIPFQDVGLVEEAHISAGWTVFGAGVTFFVVLGLVTLFALAGYSGG